MSHLCYVKSFCELLCWVSTKALGNMRYLTVNTRSNRVAIISSVITRIFFNSVQFWMVTFQPISIKTLVIYLFLCKVFMCQLNHVVFYYCCSIILLLFNFIQFFSIQFHCLKKWFMRKIFNSDPGLYSRYFDPIVHEVPVHHNLCKSNKHHTSDCTFFVLV